MTLPLMLDYSLLSDVVIDAVETGKGAVVLCRGALVYDDKGVGFDTDARSETDFPAWLRQLVWELNSGPFIGLVEQVAEQSPLLSDPHLRDGGVVVAGLSPRQVSPSGPLSDYGLTSVASVLVHLNGGGVMMSCAGSEGQVVSLAEGDCVLVGREDCVVVGSEALTDDQAGLPTLLLTHYYRITEQSIKK